MRGRKSKETPMVAPKRILVIDDDETVRRSCERVLGERGYDVETVASGRDGLDRTRRGYFDCALVDLKMPDLDGMDIVRAARESRANMALLIITGHGDMDTATEAVRLGVCEYVRKPFSPDEIAHAVNRALARPADAAAAAAGVLDRVAQEIRASSPKPEHFEHRSPQTVAEMVTRSVGVRKATAAVVNVLILGILAGAYIGFGAQLATLVGSDAAARFGTGVSQVLAGAVFSVGLMLVVIAGAELFTGNNLMVASVLSKEYGWGRMLGRWGIVYAANFVGSVLLAWIMYESGLWKMGAAAVGAKALAIAGAKVGLPWGEAFFRGIGCNWLVCLAVWMALAAKDVAGKVLAIFFPIMAFVALGYEHCVANMYFVPMGLFLKDTAAAAAATGVNLESLTWTRFVTANLVPVTLGNIVGGALFVGSAYWWTFMRGQKKKA
jgi:formate/nitrite transporter